MKKIILGIFLCMSISTFAVEKFMQGELTEKDGIFMKEGKIVEGEYTLHNTGITSNLIFRKGKLYWIEFEQKEEPKLEIEGKFSKDYGIFKGEVSAEFFTQISKNEKKEKEISLDGHLEGKPIYEFLNKLFTEKKQEDRFLPFESVSSWKIKDGSKEVEEKLLKNISKQEKEMKYIKVQVREVKEKEFFSEGKSVHHSKSSVSKIETKYEKF